MRTRTLCLLFFAASLLFAAASCSDNLTLAAESQGKSPIDVANLRLYGFVNLVLNISPFFYLISLVCLLK